MSPQPSASRTLRFGLFELDLRLGKLCKQGRKVKLQGQPFQVLEMLLSHPGEVVTREELQQALWPADTFVEFDQGLNTAIQKIRLALGDSADNPRFVETIPRKGYKFIAPVDGAVPPSVKPQAGKHRLLWLGAALGLAVVAASGVWVLRTNQSSEPPVPAPLTSYPGSEVSPSFSPDGNYVAFAWNSLQKGQGNFDIFIKLISGGDPVRLTHDPADEFSPAWSPDGRFIAFLRTLSSGATGLFLIPAIGGPERKLAELSQESGYEAYFGPYISWFPDGNGLGVGDKESPTAPLALFRISVETGEKRRLIAPPEKTFGDWSPVVSPDSSAVAFIRCVSEGVCDLFLLKLSKDLSPAGEPERLTFDNSAYRPAWTPDGRAIVFSAGPVHTPSLWKLGLLQPGSRPGKRERLAFAGQGAMEPTISRQGRLAYDQRSIDVDVWRVELNGARPAPKPAIPLISSTRIDHDARYSPDGRRIAFASSRSGSLEIWVCNSDGSASVQLTSFGSSNYTGGPRWSPDGRLIAFSSRPGGAPVAFVVSVDGGKPKRFPIDNLSGWSQDGKWIYFGPSQGGLWKLPWPLTEHAKAIQIASGVDQIDGESDDGKFIYYLKAKGGDNTLWRVPAEGGEEIPVLRSVLNDNFAVVHQGIYFIASTQPASVQFLSFTSGKVTTIARIPREPAWGFSVSPDNRWLLYSEFVAVQSDLMLVENFR